MQDTFFGAITWSRRRGQWQKLVSLPLFKGWGRGFHRWWAMPIGPEPGDEPDAAPASVAEQMRDIDRRVRTPGYVPEQLTKRDERALAALDEKIAQAPAKDRAAWEMARRFALRMRETNQIRVRPEQPAKPKLSPEEKQALAGRLTLNIAPGRPGGHVPTKPGEAQREAWRQLVARGDAVWEELLEQLFREYRARHALRVKWWRATFGEHHLQERLPAVRTKAELKELISRAGIYIQRAAPGASCADIALCCNATYGGFAALIRAGAISEFGTMTQLAFPVAGPPAHTVRHSTLGWLRRHSDDSPWIGNVHCPAFRACWDIAGTRAGFRADPEEVHRADMPLPWYFVQGDFRLEIAAPRGALPSEKQVQAVAAFRKRQQTIAREILQAAFARYRQQYAAWHKSYIDEHIDECVPKPTTPARFNELLGLMSVAVFPENRAGQVALGLAFATTWSPDGLGGAAGAGEAGEARAVEERRGAWRGRAQAAVRGQGRSTESGRPW